MPSALYQRRSSDLNDRQASQRRKARSRRRASFAAAGFIACSVATACDQAAVRSAQTVRRDSAHVEIIENGPAAAARYLGPVVDEARTVSLEGLELSRVTAARLLADGRVALTDNAAFRVVLVDPASGQQKAVGRRGDGPEEFQDFRGMWRCAADSLLVRTGLAGLRVLDANGGFAAARTTPRLRSAAYGASADCSALVLGVPNIRSDAVPNDSVTVGWYDLADDTFAEVTRVPLQARQVIDYLGEKVPVIVPFAERAVFAVAADRLYVGRTGTPEILVYDRRGRLVRIIRWAAKPEPITAADRSRYEEVRQQLDSRVRPGTTAQVPSLDAFDLPRRKPVFAGLIADDDGGLWVRKYPATWENFEQAYGPAFIDDPPEWWVFGPSGQLVGTVTTPRKLVVKDLRAGLLAGLTVTGDDLPVIHIAPLHETLMRPDVRAASSATRDRSP